MDNIRVLVEMIVGEDFYTSQELGVQMIIVFIVFCIFLLIFRGIIDSFGGILKK